MLALFLTMIGSASHGAGPGVEPGKYVGKSQGHYKLTFTVNRQATRITGFDTAVVAYCIGASGPVGPTVWRTQVPSIPLSPAGKFDRTYKVTEDDAQVTIRVRGVLVGKKLTKGRLDYRSTVPGNECETDGPQELTASRM